MFRMGIPYCNHNMYGMGRTKNDISWLYDALSIRCDACIVAEPFYQTNRKLAKDNCYRLT
jgi:hypothetical protein